MKHKKTAPHIEEGFSFKVSIFILFSVLNISVLKFIFIILFIPHLGESISSETSNGYLNETEVTWQAFDEEGDTHSTQSAHMDVTTDPQGQGNLLLSQNEALAGTATSSSGA